MYAAKGKTFDMELNTLNIMKDFNATIAKSTFVNIDQSYPQWNGPQDKNHDGKKIKHDKSYYDALAAIQPPKKTIDTYIVEHYAKNHPETKYDVKKNKVVKDIPENDPEWLKNGG